MTILCEPDTELAVALAAVIGGDVRTVAGLSAAAAALDADARETLLIVSAAFDTDEALQFVAARRRANATLAVILLRHRPEAVQDRALEIGVDSVVAVGNIDALAQECRRLAPPLRNATRGQVITVFAAKDGSGKTTFATNLAVVLHGGGARRVCLVDLDLEFGDLAGALRVSPSRTLADARDLPTRVDAADARRLATPLSPGLDALLAPVVAGQATSVSTGLVESLLDALTVAYDYVIVDTPAQLSTHVLVALDRSAHRVLLATAEAPTLKSLRELLDTLDLLSYDRTSRSIVVNRAGSRDGLSHTAVEKVLKARVACWIPASDDVPASINRGVPLAAAQPDHPVSLAVRRFTATRLSAIQLDCTDSSGPP